MIEYRHTEKTASGEGRESRGGSNYSSEEVVKGERE
jgi:hypothetical protein